MATEPAEKVRRVGTRHPSRSSRRVRGLRRLVTPWTSDDSLDRASNEVWGRKKPARILARGGQSRGARRTSCTLEPRDMTTAEEIRYADALGHDRTWGRTWGRRSQDDEDVGGFRRYFSSTSDARRRGEGGGADGRDASTSDRSEASVERLAKQAREYQVSNPVIAQPNEATEPEIPRTVVFPNPRFPRPDRRLPICRLKLSGQARGEDERARRGEGTKPAHAGAHRESDGQGGHRPR